MTGGKVESLAHAEHAHDVVQFPIAQVNPVPDGSLSKNAAVETVRRPVCHSGLNALNDSAHG